MSWQEWLDGPDLWESLHGETRSVVLYGMGNGADKILRVCAEREIPVRAVFASDGFVRGQSFHGMRVQSWSEIKETYSPDGVVVLTAFASSRPEVLENVRKIASEACLRIPDVPVFGDTLFDRPFVRAHMGELETARSLYTDEESQRIFDLTVAYKLTGRADLLFGAVSDPGEVARTVLRPERFHASLDLGAYTGDSVRDLLAQAPGLEKVFAMEPDERNFRKLSDYAATEQRANVLPVCAAAWDRECDLVFADEGNRGASAADNRSPSAPGRSARVRTVRALPPDRVVGDERIDFIKYDVEGSEREAILGSARTIRRNLPTLLVSVYHRSEDLFALPLLVRDQFPEYRNFFLRRFGGFPAWDLNFYAVDG